MNNILRVIIRRLAPREGYLAWAIFLGALACSGAAFTYVNWVSGGETLVVLIWLAAICAGWSARRSSGWRLGSSLLVLSGVALSFVVAARALPAPGYLGFALVGIPGWFSRLLSGYLDLFPLTPVFQHVLGRLALFSSHLQLWAEGVVGGGAVQDDAVFLLLALFLAWLLGVWAGWAFVRRQDAWAALTPTGTLLAIQAFFADEGFAWLVLFVGLLLLESMALAHLGRERAWQRAGMDYSTEIHLDLAMVGSLFSLSIVVAALVLPGISYRGTVDLFWKVFAEPWRGIEQTGQRLFPDLGQQARSPLRGGLLFAGGAVLPRSHLLGGTPELSKQRVLRVRLKETPENLRDAWSLYWRGLTYAQYNNRGWENEPFPDTDALDPGEPWTPSRPLGRRELWQAMEAIDAGGALLAAAEPLAADVSVQVRAYDSDGLVALELGRRTSRYAVISLIPVVSEDVLRGAGDEYPASVKERYLQLPQIPARVVDLAREVTVDAKTPYDQSRALESYLRVIPDTLEVPFPPGDRDVADWFLFDLRKGYCDYYATAFVVMARAVGLPARLAVGYVSGTYDTKGNLYNVVEADAHSWPEVYFPKYGWLPFEPTGGRSALSRSAQGLVGGSSGFDLPFLDDALLGLSELAGQREASEARNASRRALVLNLALAAVALAGFILLLRRRGRRLTPAETIVVLWDRVGQWGARLGRGPRMNETPREYASALHERWLGQVSDGENGADYLAEAYTALRYGRAEPGERDRREVEAQWQHLREQWRRALMQRLSLWRRLR
ncbi:MAG: transglutaminase domain-containing protein [Anaerolineae bacterium]|nr:transglutaminase domain-containing protein [Anaerolineae bacterium]